MSLFGHKKDKEENTENISGATYEGEEAGEEYYEGEEAGEEYYEGEEAGEEYYEGEEAEEEYYEGEEAEEEYYEGEEAEEEYYEDGEAEEEDPREHTHRYYGEDEGDGSEDEYYGIEEIDAEDDYDADERKSLFGFGLIMTAGVLIVVLAALTGTMFMRSRTHARQVAALATVGIQLDGIEVVGDSGLVAVADATIAKQEALRILQQQQREEEEKKQTEYQETNYSKKVTVSLNTVSIQKDLKIKFLN